jgi:transposase-like protein
MPRPPAVPIALAAADRATLEGWTRRRETARAPAVRARIVLACAAPGAAGGGVARALGAGRPTVAAWRKRFAGRGPDGLLDGPRPGAPRETTDAQVERAVVATPAAAPEAAPPNATHRSTRGLSTRGLSTRGLAAGRRRAGPDGGGADLPGQVERHTRDHVRHGTTDLFAAPDAKAGEVIGTCRRRHRAQESRASLDVVDRGAPSGLEARPVLDSASAHEAPPIHRWPAKRPRHRLRFTPTPASWLNLVESWLALLTASRGAAPSAAPAPWSGRSAPTSPAPTETRSPSPGRKPPTTSSPASGAPAEELPTHAA